MHQPQPPTLALLIAHFQQYAARQPIRLSYHSPGRSTPLPMSVSINDQAAMPCQQAFFVTPALQHQKNEKRDLAPPPASGPREAEQQSEHQQEQRHIQHAGGR